MTIAPKRIFVLIWNFVTFPKYQKQKFWKNLNSNFFTPPPSEGGTKKQKKFKLVLEPKLLNMIYYKQKDKKNPKDDPCISKTYRVTGIFVSQLKMKSQFLQIFKSWNLTQFLRFWPNFFMCFLLPHLSIFAPDRVKHKFLTVKQA